MRLISSAIKFQFKNDTHWQIMSGYRHSDIYKMMSQLNILYNKNTKEEGFLTDDYKFIKRSDAIKYAKESGQISKDFNNNLLLSEDLW